MQINNLAPFPYTPTSITFTTNGNYTPGDLVFDPSMISLPIKVFQSSSSTFSVGTATLLGQTLSSANGMDGEINYFWDCIYKDKCRDKACLVSTKPNINFEVILRTKL